MGGGGGNGKEGGRGARGEQKGGGGCLDCREIASKSVCCLNGFSKCLRCCP